MMPEGLAKVYSHKPTRFSIESSVSGRISVWYIGTKWMKDACLGTLPRPVL